MVIGRKGGAKDASEYVTYISTPFLKFPILCDDNHCLHGCLQTTIFRSNNQSDNYILD